VYTIRYRKPWEDISNLRGSPIHGAPVRQSLEQDVERLSAETGALSLTGSRPILRQCSIPSKLRCVVSMSWGSRSLAKSGKSSIESRSQCVGRIW